jgi:hypothetical protein
LHAIIFHLKQEGFAFMEYIFYIIFSALILCFIFYIAKGLFKRINHNKLPEPIEPLALDDDPDDDFMCLLKSDGSSIVISKGVVVTSKRLK